MDHFYTKLEAVSIRRLSVAPVSPALGFGFSVRGAPQPLSLSLFGRRFRSFVPRSSPLIGHGRTGQISSPLYELFCSVTTTRLLPKGKNPFFISLDVWCFGVFDWCIVVGIVSASVLRSSYLNGRMCWVLQFSIHDRMPFYIWRTEIRHLSDFI